MIGTMVQTKMNMATQMTCPIHGGSTNTDKNNPNRKMSSRPPYQQASTKYSAWLRYPPHIASSKGSLSTSTSSRGLSSSCASRSPEPMLLFPSAVWLSSPASWSFFPLFELLPATTAVVLALLLLTVPLSFELFFTPGSGFADRAIELPGFPDLDDTADSPPPSPSNKGTTVFSFSPLPPSPSSSSSLSSSSSPSFPPCVTE
mmetsp:Transcript_16018/g.27018  ORF Transcript_16018/g.27018 Transcript_16018/m.27018 type:complete len:202 (-) Transcript_16018:560-1165(-)